MSNRKRIYIICACAAVLAAVCALAVLFFLPNKPNTNDPPYRNDDKNVKRTETDIDAGGAGNVSGENPETAAVKDFADVEYTIKDALVLFAGRSDIFLRGERSESEPAPFYRDGEIVYSLNKAAELLGAQMTIDPTTGIVTVNSNGCTAQFMTGFNVIVYNGSDPEVIRSKPYENDVHIYLPVRVIAKILNCSCFGDYPDGIMVLKATKPPEDGDYMALLAQLGETTRSHVTNKELDKIADKYDRDDIYELSRNERLYVSDSDGELYKWIIGDDFSLAKEKQQLSREFDKNKVFEAGERSERKNLYLLGDTQVYSLIPDEIVKNDVLFAIEKFIGSRINGEAAADTFKKAAGGEYSDEFLKSKADAEENGEYEAIISENTSRAVAQEDWDRLCASAKTGDILLFRNSASDSKYGYFNHCALVMDVDREKRQIHVLQARNNELGVGADLPLDNITAQSFTSENYWKRYDRIVLCRVNGISDAEADEMVRDTYQKYNGYEFGYGGFYGAKQVTCAEIISNALDSVGRRLISGGEYRHRLKEAVKGDVLSMLILPDDIALSDEIDLIDMTAIR